MGLIKLGKYMRRDHKAIFSLYFFKSKLLQNTFDHLGLCKDEMKYCFRMIFFYFIIEIEDFQVDLD